MFEQFNILDVMQRDVKLLNGIDISNKNKFYHFDNYMTYSEIKKYEPCFIMDGLDTILHLCKPYRDTEYRFYAVVEGITGINLSYVVVGNGLTKNQAKEKAISDAKAIVEKLNSKGILEKVLLLAAANLTGMSPRYKGELPGPKLEPVILNLGDKLESISIRGCLRYYNYEVISVSEENIKIKNLESGREADYSPNLLSITETTEYYFLLDETNHVENRVSVSEVVKYLTDLVEVGENSKGLEIETTNKIIIFLTKQINLLLSGHYDTMYKNIYEVWMRGRYNNLIINVFEHFTGFRLPRVEGFDFDNFKMQLRQSFEEYKESFASARIQPGRVSNSSPEDADKLIQTNDLDDSHNTDQIITSESVNISADKIYTIEEIINLNVNIDETQIKIEDLSIYTHEEIYNKERWVWSVLHSYEKAARAGERDYSYTSYIFPINSLIHKETLKRGKAIGDKMSEDEAKLWAIKWIYNERFQEIINSCDIEELTKSIKSSYGSPCGGTLCGPYGFFIGQVDCSNKGILVKLNCGKQCKINFSEASKLLIRYYKKEGEKLSAELNIESNTAKESKEQVSLFTLTDEDIRKLSIKVKGNKKNKISEGQLSLFAV